MQLTKHIGCLLALVLATASAFAADWFSSSYGTTTGGLWSEAPGWTAAGSYVVINDWTAGVTFTASTPKNVKAETAGADSKITTKVTFTAIDGDGYTMSGEDFPQEMKDVLTDTPKAGLTVVENPAETYTYWGLVNGAWVMLNGTPDLTKPVVIAVSFFKEDGKAYVKYEADNVVLSKAELTAENLSINQVQYKGKCDLYDTFTGLAWSNDATTPEKISVEIQGGPTQVAFNHTELEKFSGVNADDDASIKAFFEKDGANGFKGWVNYAIGNTTEADIAVVSNKCEKGGVVLDFGFKVADGHTVAYKEGESTLAGGKVEDTTGIHKVDVYVDDIMVTSQDVGVMNTGKEVTQKQKDANAKVFDIIAVPFTAFNGEVTVANLLNTAELTDGDKLHIPNDDSGYNVWQWNATVGEWQVPSGAKKYGALLGAVATKPEQEILDQGEAIWLEHDANSKIVIAGTPGTSEKSLATSVEVAAPKDANEPNWQLVANPSVKSLALSTIAGNVGDQIVLEDVADPKQYEMAESGWMIYEKVEVKRTVTIGLGTDPIEVTQVEVVPKAATNAEIPAGIGFWYVNVGNESLEKPEDAKVIITFPAN